MLKKTALVLVVIGGLNWGLALFDVNLVSALLGEASALTKVVYGLIGLSALYMLMDVFKS